MTNIQKFDNSLFGELSLRLFAGVSPAWYAYLISRETWMPAPHLLLLEQHLLKTHTDKGKRLIVSMPPRHGKSEFISKYFPAWYLGANPDKRIILTSYESTFAKFWGRQVLNLIQNEGQKVFPLAINPKKYAADDFAISGHKGGMICTGIGGAITGRGADLLILDDPVKNDEEAHSITYRDNLYEWFRSTAFTRLEPGGSVILLMTRWHEDDIAGRLLRDEPEKWESLVLPAIAEENDALGRNIGEALWKERYDIKQLQEIKTTLGEYWFSALYQQRPSIEGGGIFKRTDFAYFDEESNSYLLDNQKRVLKENSYIIATVDLATSISERADFSVVAIAAISSANDILILDIIREKIEGSKHIDLLKQVYSQYKPQMIGVEAVQYQISLVQIALAEGLPVKELRPDKDKFSRALPIAAKLESGKVFFKRNAPWLGDFIDELLKFPNAKHDDQVDAFAYIDNMIANRSNIIPIGVKRKKTRGF